MDSKQLVETRLKTIIGNQFDQAIGSALAAAIEARSHNPNSGTWIIAARNSIESELQSAIERSIKTILREIKAVFRSEPQVFWDQVRQFLKERMHPAINSLQATLSKGAWSPSTSALHRKFSELAIICEQAIDRAVGNEIQKDNLSLVESKLAKKSNAPKPSAVGPIAKIGLHSYVNSARIGDLKALKKFDPIKLIRMCEELNIVFAQECFLATTMLLRAILDHVPPIFGVMKFSEVANNYQGSKSFKDSMLRLDASSRKIADAHLHTQIRSKETLPNSTQVDFSNDLDVLLAEIIRIGA